MPNSKDKTFNKNIWKPGESGNPEGRKKGSKNKSTLIKQAIEGEMIDSVKEDAVSVFKKAVDMALSGDQQMIKLVVDKFIPNAKIGGDNEGKGVGGIKIVVQGLESPAIDAERVEDVEDI